MSAGALLEDWPKEDVFEAGECRGTDLLNGVAGDAHDGVVETGQFEGLAHSAEFTPACSATEMDTGGSGCYGDVGRAVQNHSGKKHSPGRCSGGADRLDDSGCQCLQVLVGEILFAKLENAYASRGKPASLRDDRLLTIAFIACKHAPVGDGIEQHGASLFWLGPNSAVS